MTGSWGELGNFRNISLGKSGVKSNIFCKKKKEMEWEGGREIKDKRTNIEGRERRREKEGKKKTLRFFFLS